MSHVDEGTLHAYLDDELSPAERTELEGHLAKCGACRQLLAEERALLQRASTLLGSARPTERPVPPFEQVRRVQKRSAWHVRTSLAWAASIMVAVGFGYFLRGGAVLRENSAPTQFDSRVEPTATPATVAASESEEVREQKAAGPARQERSQRAQSPTLDKAPAANVVAVDSTVRRDSAVARGVALQPSVQLRGANPAERQRESDSLAALARRSEVVLNEVVVTAAPAPRAAAGAAQADASVRRDDNRSVRNLVATTWPLISRGKAASLLGDRPVGIPGLATRRIRQSPGPDSTVVVEQALDSNTVIQVFQRSASAGTDVDGYYFGSRERADRVLARYVGRLRVEIAGPVSTDSLNKLLEQVGPIP